MISFFYKHLFRITWHPSHEELLQYLDGQMSARTEAAIQAHLKGCWSCRLQQGKLERLISDFMEERNNSVPAFPSKALSMFESRLDKLDSENSEPPLRFRLFRSQAPAFHPRLSLRFTLGFVASLFLLLLLIRLSSVPPVSAKEILRYTEKAVAERIRQVPEPVIYQELQVRSYYSGSAPQDFVTWETWTDGKGNRLRQRIKDTGGPRFVPLKTRQPASLSTGQAVPGLPPVLVELERILQVNRMDVQRPLSPAAYETWRSSIQPRSEEVIETRSPGGDKALAIKTSAGEPFAPNSIVEAEFIVRVEDWHPVTQRFRVQREKGIQNFELTETAFQVLALNTLPNTISSDLPPPTPLPATPPGIVSPASIPPASITTPPHAPSHLELVAAEIEAHYALHRVKACLGEPIEIVRQLSGIKVRGLAKTEARKTELMQALQDVPWVVVEIQTIDEVVKMSSLSSRVETSTGESADAPSVETSSAETERHRLAFEKQLESYFANGAGLVEFSKEVVSLSRAALFEAWALRRLAEGYGQGEVGDLRSSSQWLLETMLREHIQDLTQQVASLRASLGPVLSSIRADEMEEPALPAAPGGTDAVWSARCRTLFFQVKQMSDLVHGLFAGASLTVTPGDAARRLSSALPQLESGLHLFKAEVAAEFSNDKSLQSNSGAKK